MLLGERAFLGGPMASSKAGNELLLLRIVVWGRVIISALGLALGASILTNTSVLGIADVSEGMWTSLTLLVTLTYIYFIYRTLVHAKNSGDPKIKHPIRWMVLGIVPIVNFYVNLSVFPRVFTQWITRFSGVSVSEEAALAFLVLTTISNYVGQFAGRVGNVELVAWTLVFDGALGALMAWKLRLALFGTR